MIPLNPKKLYHTQWGVLTPLWVGFLLILGILFVFHNLSSPSSHQKPLIGILLNNGGQGGYSVYPWYAIRQNYSQVVTQFGGVPVFIGHDAQLAEDYLNVLDGLVLTGGDVALPDQVFTIGLSDPIDPKRFPRAHMETALIKKAYQKNLPVLGICAGTQIMNVALGGTIIGDLHKTLGTPLPHRQDNREKPQHLVILAEHTRLQQILKVETLPVNSNHHAGIGRIAAPLVVNARATDGVIEGVEAPDKRFFVGVIWHPEFLLSAEEKALWGSFIHAAKDYKRKNQFL